MKSCWLCEHFVFSDNSSDDIIGYCPLVDFCIESHDYYCSFFSDYRIRREV